jgi:beta-lactamase superfamily II metal-dependent hydrolase
MKPAVLAIALALIPAQGARTLDIYFIDVEGGQSTLIVTPAGQTMIVDAGFPGTGTFSSQPGDPAVARDPQRILAVAKVAGVTRINYLLATHFHADHIGGVAELSQLIPIDAFIDHGGVTADADRVAGTIAIHQAYAAVRAGKRHIEPKPGDRIPLTGLDATIVSSAGETLSTPLAGATPGANTACVPPGVAASEKTENPRSTGVLLQFGKFRFLNVGDLSDAPLFNLACPSDTIGPVDVYLVSHHGAADAADPSLFAAIRPRVAVLNNGRTKGGAVTMFQTLRAAPGTETWQLHRSEVKGAENFPDDRIANLSDATAHWIKLSASDEGSFTVTNTRTGVTTRYPGR